MPVIEIEDTILQSKKIQAAPVCYHCGTPCINAYIAIDDKAFCCEGCKLVYEILNENGLCDYYKLESHPGLTKIKPLRNDKYSYLDNEKIAEQLFEFTDGNNAIVKFYIPGVHCSSCMWLMEHLHKLNLGISESRLNFTTKEVTIHFSRKQVSLRQVVELLSTIGYEPYISLNDSDKTEIKKYNKQRVYKLGVAGFCFGNIMMMSFPEYLSVDTGIEHQYANLFRILNLVLALPVFFYCASEFFVTAWKGIQQKTLNIDAPIALAIIITFSRSLYEIMSGTGAGYLDSMSGIVFFMLVGRLVQERTYKSLSFHRDYRSYFPIAVNVLVNNKVISKNIQDLREKDIVQLHNEEIIPADAIILKGKPCIDYSFVTGESEPVNIEIGKMVYAGGKQLGEQLTIQVIKPVSGSYLTSLWNHYAFAKDKTEENDKGSIVHVLSRYFTWILLGLAVITALFWSVYDPAKIIGSVSAMLIVACPCALLLSANYTNANLLRIFSNNGLFLRDTTVIEQLKKIDTVVFDKTGTLTYGTTELLISGHQLTDEEKDIVYTAVIPSKHPYSRYIAAHLGTRKVIALQSWEEIPGNGISASVGDNIIRVGSANFIGIPTGSEVANVYININNKITGLCFVPDLRSGVPEVLATLQEDYSLALVSGDNDKQKAALKDLFNAKSELLFDQKPLDKLTYIERLQEKGKHVLMIGDGLNDAGALQQSNVGITLAEDINTFTPSCDAILDAQKFTVLPALLKLSKYSSNIINIGFGVSIVYNIIGLSYAMMGTMKPVIAAILMPCSTISIVLISTGVSSLVARRLGLLFKSK